MSISSIGAGNPNGAFPITDPSSATQTDRTPTQANDPGAAAANSPAASVEISSGYKAPKLTPEEWAALRADRKTQHDTYVAGLKATTAQKHTDQETKDAAQDSIEAAKLADLAALRASRHKT